jgi:hypothetical protein
MDTDSYGGARGLASRKDEKNFGHIRNGARLDFSTDILAYVSTCLAQIFHVMLIHRTSQISGLSGYCPLHLHSLLGLLLRCAFLLGDTYRSTVRILARIQFLANRVSNCFFVFDLFIDAFSAACYKPMSRQAGWWWWWWWLWGKITRIGW